jgi:hypothetical protein
MNIENYVIKIIIIYIPMLLNQAWYGRHVAYAREMCNISTAIEVTVNNRDTLIRPKWIPVLKWMWHTWRIYRNCIALHWTVQDFFDQK